MTQMNQDTNQRPTSLPGYQIIPSSPEIDAHLLLAALLRDEMAGGERRRVMATIQALTGRRTYSPSSDGGILSGCHNLGSNLSNATQPLLSSLTDLTFRPNPPIPKGDIAAPAAWTSTFPLTRSTSPITQPSLSGISGSDSDDSKTVIRKEQVEAALRSSPQRGRKRTNLNEMERQELIRNRNREHAKETRLRKKMRQEELEEKERKLRVHEQKETLQQARRQTVIQYLECRENMLHSLSFHLDGAVSNDESAQEDNEDYADLEVLHNVIHDINSFKFIVGDLKIAKHPGQTTLEHIRSYDVNLATKIEASFGDSALPSVQYVVQNGEMNVSLDCFDGGVAEVDVVLSTNPQVPLQQGFLKFKFAGSESSKLSSVHWRITQELLASQVCAVISQESVKPSSREEVP